MPSEIMGKDQEYQNLAFNRRKLGMSKDLLALYFPKERGAGKFTKPWQQTSLIVDDWVRNKKLKLG